MLGITKDIKSLSALNWEVLKSEKKIVLQRELTTSTI